MGAKKRVTIDADLRELIPQYLANRETDLGKLHTATLAAEWKAIEVIAHRIAGSAGGYGFDDLGQIALRMEAAAKAADAAHVRAETEAMIDYLRGIEVEYV